MTGRGRLILFLLGAACTAALVGAGISGMPAFGTTFHPYRTMAVMAAVRHATANVVSSINFDQRGFDTLGEESILFASVAGAATLLRPSREEEEERAQETGIRAVLPATTLTGYLMLGITLIVGFDVVLHGHLTPGGGFQGGIVIGTALHLLYVAGTYRALRRLRPEEPFELGEAIGIAGFAGIGFAGLVAGGSFLLELLPYGTYGEILSGGTVPLLNIAVGVAVASATMVLLAQFFRQALELRTPAAASSEGPSAPGPSSPDTPGSPPEEERR